MLMWCIRNTSVEPYYVYDGSAQLDGYYYLNTFDNILASGGKTYCIVCRGSFYESYSVMH